jgi:hypothetical protein
MMHNCRRHATDYARPQAGRSTRERQNSEPRIQNPEEKKNKFCGSGSPPYHSGFWILNSVFIAYARSEDDALDHGVGLLVLMKNSSFVIVWLVSTCGRVTEYDLLKYPV